MKSFEMKKWILFVMLLSTFGFQCEDDCESFVINEYEIDLRNLLRKQYSIDDSIHVFKEIDSKFVLKNGESFDNSNLSISFNMILLKIRSDFSAIDSGYVYFDVDLNNSSQNSLTSLRDDVSKKYSLNCNESSCIFDLTLKPKTKGIYCIGFMGFGDFGSSDECESNRLEILLSNGNNNYQDLVKSPYLRLWFDTNPSRVSIENPASRNDFYFFEVK